MVEHPRSKSTQLKCTSRLVTLYFSSTSLLQEERGVFLINEWFRWETALNLYENFWYLESNPWNFYTAVCRIFYNDHRLMEYVRANHFDVAIVDLITNECMLALPASLDIPVVGFWVTLPVSGAMEASTQPSNPSYVPYGMTGFTDKMGFLTRVQNCIYKFLHTMLMQYHWHGNRHSPQKYIQSCTKTFLLSYENHS